MKNIIFDLLMILAESWVIFDKDSPEVLKRFALLGIILLEIYVILQVLEMNGII